MAPVTSLYAALLALVFLVLSAQVVQGRRAGRVSLGTGGDPALERAIRVHANFAEYVPLALVLMLLAELAGYHAWVLHLTGLGLLAGRLLHAWGLAKAAANGRAAGTVATFAVLGVLALLLLAAGLSRS